jgi:UDP-N-acetylmuramate dehydrogenase
MNMEILKDVPLANYSSMKLGGTAKFLVEIKHKNEIIEAINWAKTHNLKYLVVGGGNNIIWRDEGFDGLILVNKILEIDEQKIDELKLFVKLGAGENWDHVVERYTAQNYSGIEYLSLIPGTCGAAPIQNIGAYGGDISTVLDHLEAYDTKTNEFVSISNTECYFGYRASIFKYREKNRYIITSITIMLEKKNPIPPFYKAIEEYLKTNNIIDVSPIILRKAVIAIRQSKLPDPKINPNTGSFFANPIIPKTDFDNLLVIYPEIVYWPDKNNTVKLSAGWLIDQIGYKNKYDPKTGMATWKNHSLTLYNKSAKSTNDLLAFKEQIVSSVRRKFDVTLEQEPELLP